MPLRYLIIFSLRSKHISCQSSDQMKLKTIL